MEIEVPRTEQEANAYRNMILSSEHGKGLVFSGGFYHILYESYIPNPKTLKCEGIALKIKQNLDNKDADFRQETVLFEDEKIGLLDSINGKTPRPFKIRFKEKCDEMIAVVTEFDNHNRKVKESAESVVKCKMSIDDLVSEVTGGKSVSHVKMIAEQENVQKALPESTKIINPKDAGLFVMDNIKSESKPEHIKQPELEVIIRDISRKASVSSRETINDPEHSWQGKIIGYHPNTNRSWGERYINAEFSEVRGS